MKGTTNTAARDYYGYGFKYMTIDEARTGYNRFIDALDKIKSAKIKHRYTEYPDAGYWTFESFIHHRCIVLIGEY